MSGHTHGFQDGHGIPAIGIFGFRQITRTLAAGWGRVGCCGKFTTPHIRIQSPIEGQVANVVVPFGRTWLKILYGGRDEDQALLRRSFKQLAATLPNSMCRSHDCPNTSISTDGIQIRLPQCMHWMPTIPVIASVLYLVYSRMHNTYHTCMVVPLRVR